MSEPNIVKRLKEVMKRAVKVNRTMLVVSIPSDQNKRDAGEGITNAELGIIHEFGVTGKGIPERSFMRSTLSEESKNLNKLSGIKIAECLRGDISAHDAYAVVGDYLQGKIVDKIDSGEFEENNPETIKRKGSSKPLIDEGELRASIKYEVRARES